jgi:hypothetical protein
VFDFPIFRLWAYLMKGGLLVPEGIIRPVVIASLLTRFIRYIHYWNIQFPNNAIIIKTNVFLPPAYVTITEFGYSVCAPLFTWTQRFLNYMAFPSLDLARTLWRLFQKRVVCTKLDIWGFLVLIHIIYNKSVKVFRDSLIAFLRYNLGEKTRLNITMCG